MKIKEGDCIRDFLTQDLEGNRIRLSDFNNKKVLLSFYRYASCPLCNLRIHELIKKYEYYQEKGLEVIAFFESPRETILKYVGRQRAPFLIIPDPVLKIYNLYSVEHSVLKYITGLLNGKLIKSALKGFLPGKMDGLKTMVPSDFLLDRGVIKVIYRGKDISDHIPFSEIEEFLE